MSSETTAKFNDFFDGWASTMPSTVINKGENAGPAIRRLFARGRLSSDDMIRVARSTVRESYDHRHWPTDVVEKFMTAEVIKRKK